MRINKNNNKGVSSLPLIIFLPLWVLTTFVFFIYYESLHSLNVEINKIENQKRELTGKEGDIEDKLRNIESLVGFYEEGKIKVDISNKLIPYLKTLNTNDDKPGTKQYYGIDDYILPYELKNEEELLKKDCLINLENVLNIFEKRINTLNKEKELLKKYISQVDDAVKEKIKEKDDILKKKDSMLANLSKEEEGIKQRFEEQLNIVIESKNKAQSDKEKAIKQIAVLEEKIKTEKNDYENSISKKKNQIRQLQAAKYGRTIYSEITKQRKYEPEQEKIDGEIVFADPRAKTVYINIGTKQKVIRGIKFDVYRLDKKGIKTFKGRIEVQKVMEKVSVAAIIEQNNLDPLVQGDRLVNPVFNRGVPVYFVFAGEFNKFSNKYTKTLIENIGGKVEDTITARTNFVVVGNKKGTEHSNYLSAIKFGIPLISEEVILTYIGD